MLFQIILIVLTVIFFKKIIEWLFGKDASVLNFLGEVFSLIGKVIGSILTICWKIFRFIFQLLIYKPKR
jgi:hypothetical protein